MAGPRTLETESHVARTKANRRAITRKMVMEDGRQDILAEYVLGYVPQEFHCEMMVWQQAHQEGLLLAWRGAAKTTFCTVARCIYEIIHNPNVRILLASDAQDQAKTILRSIKAHLKSDKFKDTFGDYVTGAAVWTETEIMVNRRTSMAGEPTIMCAGIGTTLPTRHFEVIIADDLVTEDNSQTEGLREKTHNYFYKTLLPALMSPHGKLWVIGTRWHEEDLYGWLQKNDYVDAIFVMGVLDEETEQSLWESNFPTARMLRIRKGNPGAFELQYQCRSGQAEGGIFNKEHFRYYETLPPSYFKWQGVDLAVGQASHNDFFAHVTIAIEKTEKYIYLVDFRKMRLTVPRQPKFIEGRFLAHPDTVKVVIETNAFQLGMKQTMVADYPHVPVIGRHTIKDKIARAGQVATILTNKPLFVRHQHHEFVRMLTAFPKKKGSKDVFDAFEIAISQGLRGVKKKRDKEPGLI